MRHVPSQIRLLPVIAIPTGKDEPMVMVIGPERTGLPLTQDMLDVRRQVTTSPFTGI